MNKIWIRKHERVVSESISVSAQLLALATGIPFVALYVLEGAYEGAVGDGVLLFVSLALIMIGIGFWVEGEPRQGHPQTAWAGNGRRADGRARTAFHPDLCRKVGIDLDSVLSQRRSEGERPDSSPAALREEVAAYLATTPPFEQAGQLRDVLSSLVEIDDRISEREELMLEELGGMIEDYVGGTSSANFHVFIAPKSADQEDAVAETMPHLKKERRLGGEVFRVGQYHSRA